MASSATATSPLLLVAAVVTLQTISLQLVDARPPENKIVGGSEMDIINVPWQVSLIISKPNKTTLCGGVIVNQRWIMTAGHCTLGASAITVRAGSSYLYRGGSTYRSAAIKTHPRYDDYFYYNDIGLVMTETPVVFGRGVASASLPAAGAAPPPPGSPLLVSGWGRTTPAEKEVAPRGGEGEDQHLMAAEMEVDDIEDCRVLGRNPDASLQICAGGGGGRGCCSGDSGGPVVDGDGVVVGLVSYGNTTECGAFPGVITRVSSHVDWLQENIPLPNSRKNKPWE